MAQGYDGYEALKGRKFIIDDENGQIMSSIIRSFLLGELRASAPTETGGIEVTGRMVEAHAQARRTFSDTKT